LQILSTRQGSLYVIRRLDDGKLHIAATGMRVPVALEEFEKYAAYPTYALRVTGLAASRKGNEVELFAAYDYWNRAKKCFATSVSKLPLTVSDKFDVKAAGDWIPVYESKPCLEATTGYDAVQTGGRLAIRADGGLLLSLGDRGINGLNGPSLAEKPDNDYGKVIQLDADGTHARIFTLGHRNPQGLTIGPDGRVWETEHGPQGGDEINLLLEGGDYGWPSVSYGTDYGHFVWPYSPDAHDHGSRSEPVLAFVPSIGISNLVVSHSASFPAWEGDLLVSSLKAETLYRVRIRDTRAIYAEPIEIGHRIRDMVWNSAGDLIMWTDDGFVISLSPAALVTAYDQCSGCHEPRGQMPALGPPLRSILGHKVADHFEFGYSPALRALGGTWTEERLNEFLRDPGAYAPGTTMTFRGIADDAERAKVIEFLKEYE
jgi:aldose sugar dehydrogenase